jgi:ATP-dependent Clp protease adapter protein ClpS
MERELIEYLELLDRVSPREMVFDAALGKVIDMALPPVYASGRDSVEIGGVLAALFHAEDAYARMLLHAAGIDRIDLLRQLSHGTRNVRPIAPDGARWLHVRFHNDHYTTMEFVTLVLEQIFRLSKLEAEELMRTVHHEGDTLVATLDAPVAIDRAQQVHDLAQQAGFPLRVTLEAAE